MTAPNFEDEMQKMKAQIENKNTMSEDMVGNQWKAGDDCGQNGCTHGVHKRTHPRNSQLDTEPHKDAPEVEFVCTHHGIVAKR